MTKADDADDTDGSMIPRGRQVDEADLANETADATEAAEANEAEANVADEAEANKAEGATRGQCGQKGAQIFFSASIIEKQHLTTSHLTTSAAEA